MFVFHDGEYLSGRRAGSSCCAENSLVVFLLIEVISLLGLLAKRNLSEEKLLFEVTLIEAKQNTNIYKYKNKNKHYSHTATNFSIQNDQQHKPSLHTLNVYTIKMYSTNTYYSHTQLSLALVQVVVSCNFMNRSIGFATSDTEIYRELNNIFFSYCSSTQFALRIAEDAKKYEKYIKTIKYFKFCSINTMYVSNSFALKGEYKFKFLNHHLFFHRKSRPK